MFNIYVGNLSFDTSESEVRDLFASFGEVSTVNLIMDRDTGRPRGFCFVEMNDQAAGERAIGELNGTQFGGRSLTVNEAKPRAPRGGSGGRW